MSSWLFPTRFSERFSMVRGPSNSACWWFRWVSSFLRSLRCARKFLPLFAKTSNSWRRNRECGDFEPRFSWLRPVDVLSNRNREGAVRNSRRQVLFMTQDALHRAGHRDRGEWGLAGPAAATEWQCKGREEDQAPRRFNFGFTRERASRASTILRTAARGIDSSKRRHGFTSIGS